MERSDQPKNTLAAGANQVSQTADQNGVVQRTLSEASGSLGSVLRWPEQPWPNCRWRGRQTPEILMLPEIVEGTHLVASNARPWVLAVTPSCS